MAVFLLGVLILALIAILAVAAYRLAVFAVPFMAGIEAAKFAYDTGAGMIGAAIIGPLCGILTFFLLSFLFVMVNNPILRTIIGAIFVVPATIAGYALVLGVTRATMESEAWQQILSVAGAIVIGISALVQLIGGLAWEEEETAPEPRN